MQTVSLRPLRRAAPVRRAARRAPLPPPRAASASGGGGAGDVAAALARAAQRKLEAGFTAAATAATDAARSLDDRFGPPLRSRARALASDAARLAPYWQRRAAEFARSPAAKPTAIAVLMLLAVTGLLGRVLNLLFLFWFLAPIIMLPLAAREAEKRAADAARAQERARWGPAADWMETLKRGAAGGGRGGGSSEGGARGGGPVIDVEWREVDK